MGKEQTRAIVVVDQSVTDADLTAYHDQGVRGIRFNINCGYSGDWTKIERLAERIAPMGWSACFWMPADLLMEMKGARAVVDSILEQAVEKIILLSRLFASG